MKFGLQLANSSSEFLIDFGDLDIILKVTAVTNQLLFCICQILIFGFKMEWRMTDGRTFWRIIRASLDTAAI